jgi:eukaryotic-like serine/threonine-protein kinase
MALDTVDSLIDALRGRPILRPEQFDELLRDHVPSHTDNQELARTLIRLRWLTLYQAKKLIAGKADELVIGPYVVLDKLGEGGMGKVYKALQLSLNRVVALKVVRSVLLKNEVAMKRFLREVKAAADLNHPNIVRVFDADQIGDKHFLAMEHIAGSDLARLVKEQGPLPIGMACSCARQAALGLQHAHDRKMVHRDIKPSNLLVIKDPKGQYSAKNIVKILDMGLARVKIDEANGEQLSSELTRSGTVIGTPDFMSPEQAKNSSGVDHRSDLYSLGCTLYFLLTGDVPFPVGNPLEKLLQHQMDPPRPVQLLRMDIPPEVATIVHCLLAKKPDDRFQSGSALANALEPWCTSTGNSTAHPAVVLKAEAVDPASATLETVPHDPFDFGANSDRATPVTSKGPPALSRTPPPKQRWRERPWLIGLAAFLAVGLAIGMVSLVISVLGRKKQEEPPPTSNEAPKQDPPKLVSPKPKQDTPVVRDLETIEKYLPNDTSMVLLFDVKQWQSTPVGRQMIVNPLLERLAGWKFLTGIDLLAITDRVVIGIVPDETPGDVIVLQGRLLVTQHLIDGVKSFPGTKKEATSESGPEFFQLGGEDRTKRVFIAFTESSVIISHLRSRIVEALEKKDNAKQTKLVDPAIERGLQWAHARPFAVFATIGLKHGWAQTQPAASKLSFIATGLIFDERGMHLHTLAEEQEAGNAMELQKVFGRMLAAKAKESDPPDARLDKISTALLEAKPTQQFLKKGIIHMEYLVPPRKIEESLAPFSPGKSE